MVRRQRRAMVRTRWWSKALKSAVLGLRIQIVVSPGGWRPAGGDFGSPLARGIAGRMSTGIHLESCLRVRPERRHSSQAARWSLHFGGKARVLAFRLAGSRGWAPAQGHTRLFVCSFVEQPGLRSSASARGQGPSGEDRVAPRLRLRCGVAKRLLSLSPRRRVGAAVKWRLRFGETRASPSWSSFCVDCWFAGGHR